MLSFATAGIITLKVLVGTMMVVVWMVIVKMAINTKLPRMKNGHAGMARNRQHRG
jgi:hypothetical protein